MATRKPRDGPQLFNRPVDKMSPDDRQMLLEQYKLYVGLMDKISERRTQANTFFLTANVLLISAIASFLTLADRSPQSRYLLIGAALVGIIFSQVWSSLVRSYRQLNTGKFEIIHRLEERLPANLFRAEWDVLAHGDGSRYSPFSHVESSIPSVFALLYVGIILFFVVELFQRSP